VHPMCLGEQGYQIGYSGGTDGYFMPGGPLRELKELLKVEGSRSDHYILKITVVESIPKFRWSMRLKQWIPLKR
jgi:hypothetical protein